MNAVAGIFSKVLGVVVVLAVIGALVYGCSVERLSVPGAGGAADAGDGAGAAAAAETVATTIAPPAAVIEQIQFDEAATAKTITGSVVPGQSLRYLFWANATQVAAVAITGPAVLSVLTPNGARVVTGVNDHQFALEMSGNYEISVTPSGDGGQFQLSLSIPEDGAAED